MARYLLLILLTSSLVGYSSTVLVINTNDSGPGSLRQAIADAQPGDTIRFSNSLIALGSDSIVLSSELSFNKPLTIIGLYSTIDTLFISGSNSTGIFNIVNAGPVFLDSLTLINGFHTSTGAAIHYTGNDTLRLSNCTFRGNVHSSSADSAWGGALSGSNMIIDQCVFEQNKVIVDGSTAGGGAVFCSGRAIIQNSLFSFNEAYASGNYVFGGAVHSRNPKIEYCEYVRNKARAGGDYSGGGAVYSIDTLVIHFSTFTSNRAEAYHHAYGGAVHVESDKYTWGSTIFSLFFSTCDNNSALAFGSNAKGGAIYVEGNALISKSTVYNNSSVTYGGYAIGGGIYSNSGSAVHSTITNNTCSASYTKYGGGFWTMNSPTMYLSTIDAFNFPGFQATEIYSAGFNIFSDTYLKGQSIIDQTGVSQTQLDLRPLDFYGGVTKTLMPSYKSVAVNNGDPNDLTTAQNIQIKNIRDVGAAEGCEGYWIDSQIACQNFVWMNNQTYLSDNNTDVFVIPNGSSTGCDSIVRLNLTVMNIDTAIVQNGNTLLSLSQGSFQWLNCANNFSAFSGETSPSFTPSVWGSYAVQITNGNCVDTTMCRQIGELPDMNTLSLYPNPSSSFFTVHSIYPLISISVYDAIGKEIRRYFPDTNPFTFELLNCANGVYFVSFETELGIETERIVLAP